MRSTQYERFAGLCAVAAGGGGLAYSIAFLLLLYSDAPETADKLNSIFLMAGGMLAIPVFVALYGRLRGADPGFALLAAVLGVAGAIGTAIHGAYRVANLIKPPAVDIATLPNGVNPRGLLTFGFTSLALLAVAWLALRGAALPRGLGWLSLVASALLMVIYLGRLIILNPKNPLLLGAAVITGFLVNPLLYLWIGRELWGAGARPAETTTATAT